MDRAKRSNSIQSYVSRMSETPSLCQQNSNIFIFEVAAMRVEQKRILPLLYYKTIIFVLRNKYLSFYDRTLTFSLFN